MTYQLHELESLLGALLVAARPGYALFGSCHESMRGPLPTEFLEPIKWRVTDVTHPLAQALGPRNEAGNLRR